MVSLLIVDGGLNYSIVISNPQSAIRNPQSNEKGEDRSHYRAGVALT